AIFVRNEDHSASSCGSGTGLAIELARKCTVSADSLLLHTGVLSDESGASGVSGEESTDIRSASTLKPSLSYIPGQRRISGSISSDHIHQPSKSEQTKSRRSVSPKPLTTRKTTTSEPEPSAPGTSASTSSARRRKGSMAFVSSGKIAKLLRRT
ncbi:unnamed protein product, partial [Oppiella nova]